MILFLASDTSQFGGIQEYTKSFREGLSELGVRNDIVERMAGGFAAKASFAVKFIAAALSRRPDFIVCTNINFAPLCFLSKKILGIPYSINFYGIEARQLNYFQKVHVRSAALVLAPFEETLRNVLRQVSEANGRTMILPNPVNTAEFIIKERSAELATRYGLDPGAKIILTICRMSKLDGDNKGYRRVIRAMPETLKTVPNAKYLLVGGGDDVPGAKALAERLGLQEKVIFAGRVEAAEMADHYNLADVFALPSKNEGFPAIVLLESLVSGVPVVGGNQPDSVVPPWNGEVALIAEADNIPSIARAVIEILSGNAPKTLYDREFLRKRIIADYGPEAHLQKVRKFLELIAHTT